VNRASEPGFGFHAARSSPRPSASMRQNTLYYIQAEVAVSRQSQYRIRATDIGLTNHGLGGQFVWQPPGALSAAHAATRRRSVFLPPASAHWACFAWRTKRRPAVA